LNGKLKGRDDFSHSHLLLFDTFKIPFGLRCMMQFVSISRLSAGLGKAGKRHEAMRMKKKLGVASKSAHD